MHEVIEGARMPPRVPTLFIAVGAGVALVALATLIAWSGTPAPLAALCLYALFALVGIVGTWCLWNRGGASTVVLIALVGIAARAALFAASPQLSHDAYRYLWDGRLLLAGGDPLATAPENVPAAFRAALSQTYAFVDYRSIPSLYPPFAYGLFALGATLRPDVWGEKLVFLAGDVVTAALVARVLALRRLPSGRLAMYAWSPVVLLEFAWSGHLEAWALAPLIATILALGSRAASVAALTLAAAVLVKLYPLALVPIVFLRQRLSALLTLGVVMGAYLVERVRTPHVFGALGSYFDEQRFDGVLYSAFGKEIAGLLVVAAVAFATLARQREAPLVSCLLFAIVAILVSSPNVLPWYTTVIVALLPLESGAFTGRWRALSFGLIGWTLTVPLAYDQVLYHRAGTFVAGVFEAASYAPLVAGLALAAAVALRGRFALRRRIA